MRYSALTAILLAATAVVAIPAEIGARDYDYDAADAPCTDDAVPTTTKYHAEYVTMTAAPVVETVTIRRKKYYGHKSKYPTYKPEPTYEPEPIYEPEPEPTYEPEPTSKKSKPTSSPVEEGSYSDQCLKAHNVRRAVHGAQDLVWDDELAAWAHKVSSTCVFEHSGGPYGENLAAGGDGTPEEFVGRWYDEGVSEGYNYGSGGFSSETGHFTQVVWKGTSRLGCATVNCPGLGNYFTCEYADAGNYEGQYQENVSPPSPAPYKSE